jgi:hypothetical protein
MTWSDVTEIVTGPSAEPLRTSRDLLSFSEEARASKTSRC